MCVGLSLLVAGYLVKFNTDEKSLDRVDNLKEGALHDAGYIVVRACNLNILSYYSVSVCTIISPFSLSLLPHTSTPLRTMHRLPQNGLHISQLPFFSHLFS